MQSIGGYFPDLATADEDSVNRKAGVRFATRARRVTRRFVFIITSRAGCSTWRDVLEVRPS